MLRFGAAIVGMGLLLATPFAQAQESAAHAAKSRSVSVKGDAKTAYIVLDGPVLEHSLAGLGDLRLFAGEREVPYALRTANGGVKPEESHVEMANKGARNGGVGFLLDVPAIHYDRISLGIAAHDFVAHALVRGANTTNGPWTELGDFSLFDFNKENLGGNSTIQFKTPVSFRFLDIQISGPVKPEEIQSATVANYHAEDPHYLETGASVAPTAHDKTSVFEWKSERELPLDRVRFEVDAQAVNFNRQLQLSCDGQVVLATEISRVKMQRSGRRIESENLDVFPYAHCADYKVTINNGDDPPLSGLRLHAYMNERRMYFEPKGGSAFTLYYGDQQLPAPTYDYAKFFAEADAGDAVAATLGAEVANPHFTARADERPWTEQHPAVMWVVIIGAIAVLGLWAIKGFTAAPQQKGEEKR